MKVKELIETLQGIPAEKQDAEIEIYIGGRISGFLPIDDKNPLFIPEKYRGVFLRTPYLGDYE